MQFSLKQDASTEYILSKNRGEKGYVGGPKCFDENPPLPGQHCLKVPKCEIFHLFDFNDFYGIKSV